MGSICKVTTFVALTSVSKEMTYGVSEARKASTMLRLGPLHICEYLCPQQTGMNNSKAHKTECCGYIGRYAIESSERHENLMGSIKIREREIDPDGLGYTICRIGYMQCQALMTWKCRDSRCQLSQLVFDGLYCVLNLVCCRSHCFTYDIGTRTCCLSHFARGANDCGRSDTCCT